MFGKSPRLSPLESRKQLLIAESALNRAQLVQDWHALKEEVHVLADQAGTIRSLFSATASLVGGLASLRRKKSTPTDAKPSWGQTLLKGAGLVSTLWQAFRPRNGDRAKD